MATKVNENGYPVSSFQLWLGAGGGPVIWAIYLVVAYGLLSVSCHRGLLGGTILGMETLRFLLLILTLAAIAAIAASWSVSYRNKQKLQQSGDRERNETLERSLFMARVGVILNAVFLFSLVITLVPVFFLDPCVF